MRKYIEHIKQKPAHERRIHAMQAAGAITAFVFVVWVTTLGFSLSAQGGGTIVENAASTQTANTSGFSVPGSQPRLEVASSSNSQY